MPISSSAATIDKKKPLRIQTNLKPATENNADKNLLKIEPAFPQRNKRVFVRSYSTLNASSLSKTNEPFTLCDPVTLQTDENAIVHVSRTEKEKEKHADRISLDRRGLTNFPIIDGESRLRLLSLQHNLVSNLEGLKEQTFPFLVFLDVYDNQLEQITSMDGLENLRVLLMGKNRIKKIEGLEHTRKLEVLDLHGNQISQIGGLDALVDLKVLNLAGNQLKAVSAGDFRGLAALQELNLRRNRCRKLGGFSDTPNLTKLFISNNDLQCVEDISNLARSSNIREISIDGNPVFLGGECVSFLVSYLPQLVKMNGMQVTDQVRKAAMAWRRNKESTSTTFMDLTSDVSLNVRREEVISNARTNWELLRSQTKCLTSNNATAVERSIKNLKPDSDFILTSLSKSGPVKGPSSRPRTVVQAPRVPVLPDKKFNLTRTPSQDTETSQNTSSSNASGSEAFRLPPILVPIINRLPWVDQKGDGDLKPKKCGSASSLGPNRDSPVSSLASDDSAADDESSSSSEAESSSSEEEPPPPLPPVLSEKLQETVESVVTEEKEKEAPKEVDDATSASTSTKAATETDSNLSTKTSSSNTSLGAKSSSVSSETGTNKSRQRTKSALVGKSAGVSRTNTRAVTAKPKRPSPPLSKDREQGGDYLIEICGRHLNVYGQGALRFIDKPWNVTKSGDVNTVNFNYVNFNSIFGILFKLKHRFPNADNFTFRETNIIHLGQLNALAEIQGLSSLKIEAEGNPICEKDWRSYAIYRLAHWGLNIINDEEVTEEEIASANNEFQSLSDLVLWSLPEVLLQPLLVRLRIDVNHNVSESNAKKWLLTADPALRSVVCKEALQWKKGTTLSQEDHLLRQRAKQHIACLFDEMNNAAAKLRLLDPEWPKILHEFVRNTLLDYSQLDIYMKKKMQELTK